MCTVLLPLGVNPIAVNKYVYLYIYLSIYDDSQQYKNMEWCCYIALLISKQCCLTTEVTVKGKAVHVQAQMVPGG
jgi:hypothetical protein